MCIHLYTRFWSQPLKLFGNTCEETVQLNPLKGKQDHIMYTYFSKQTNKSLPRIVFFLSCIDQWWKQFKQVRRVSRSDLLKPITSDSAK